MTFLRGLVSPGAGAAPFEGVVELDGPTIARVERAHENGEGGLVLVPGFVDLQVNGVGDADFATADPGVWRTALQRLAAAGVTTCCPTLVSAPLDAYGAPLAVASSFAGHGGTTVGAEVVGVHLEGPFLGGAPGAHPVDLLRPADVGWLASLLDAHPGLVRIVTLAPEADPGGDAVRFLAGRGVVVALGHTSATYDRARAAADGGARLVTHLFNGMAPLHHRAPGLAGAALDDDRLTASVIADLVHVHPALLRTAIAAKRDLLLVSDAVATPGLTVGDDGAARLADGTLAGATALLDRALRNVVGLGVALERAVELVSTNPARLLGLADRGVLAPGARADVVALDRATLSVRAVWLAGTPQPFVQK